MTQALVVGRSDQQQGIKGQLGVKPSAGPENKQATEQQDQRTAGSAQDRDDKQRGQDEGSEGQGPDLLQRTTSPYPYRGQGHGSHPHPQFQTRREEHKGTIGAIPGFASRLMDSGIQPSKAIGIRSCTAV